MDAGTWIQDERRWLNALGLLLVMCAVVFAARAYVLRSIADDWPAQQREVHTSLMRTITGRIEALATDIQASGTRVLEEAENRMGSSDMLAARMIERMRQDPYSFEWRDGRGALRAYAGEPIRHGAPEPSMRRFAVIDRTPYHLLVATLPGPGRGESMSVATPFAPSVPASRRILHEEGFLPALSRDLDVELTFHPRRPVRSDGVVFAVLAHGDTLGHISFAATTRENHLDLVSRRFDAVLLLLALGFATTATFPLFRLYRRWPRAASATAMLLHIWTLRYALLFSGFSGLLLPADLRDPAFYASGLGWGLAASPAELTLSVLALLASTVVLHRAASRPAARGEGKPDGVGKGSGMIARAGALLLVFGLLPFTLRAFAACLRSFVVDSSFNFDSIDGLLDEPMLLLMIANSYLCALALGFGLLAMYLAVKRAIDPLGGPARRLPWLLGGAAWSMLLLFATTESFLLPRWSYAAYALLFLAPAILRVPPLRGRSGTLFAPLLVATAAGSLLTVTLYGRFMEVKRMSEIEAIAIDLSRPVDGWSQVLMEQTLQYLSRAAPTADPDGSRMPAAVRGDDGTTPGVDHAAAFQLWAGSPLSRLQNNSAVLLLDSGDTPRSRFAVGNDPFLLSMRTLASTVARTEGIVQVTDRQSETGERRYYQGYTDLPRKDGGPAVAVVILEALDPMDMAAQGIDLLRNAPAKLSSAPEDQFIVTRFRGSRIMQSSERAMERAECLPVRVDSVLREEGETVWDALAVGGDPLETYFMRLPVEDEVLAITRGKSDPLLAAYRVLRIVVLFAFFSAVIWFLASLLGGRVREWRRLTFARRLQLALLGIAAIPLLLIWITGRDFALETTLDEIERQVSEDLDMLRSNILAQLADSIPLASMETRIDDQSCQEILQRTGRDLNVYRGTKLVATSRPELYHVGVLNNRLQPDAWLNIVLRGRDAWFAGERIGEFSYQVGYRALRDGSGALAAVISTPTLFQRERVDRGYTRASATVFIWIVSIALLVALVSAALARQISRPLSELLRATRDITAGNLDRRVHVSGSAEIVDLMDAFNSMTARLRRSQEELAAAERELAWKEMAKQVAHEIRNPLTPMKLAVQHLQRAWHDGAAQIGDIIEKVTATLIDQIERLSHISDEFSRFARMPRRSTAHVDVGEVLRDTVALFGSHEGITFALRLESGLPPVLADRDELARAFTNLLRNAVQATQEHGAITVEAARRGADLTIRISDTGSGIPAELIPRIFEPNFSTRTEGMGLGLAIVRKIITDADGAISIESTPGEGTTVTVTLPAA